MLVQEYDAWKETVVAAQKGGGKQTLAKLKQATLSFGGRSKENERAPESVG